jgi:hypothetical protein
MDKAKGKRHPPPLKLWRTGKAEGESGGLTRSREGAPPSRKLWRAGHAEVMRSALLSVARCRLVAAARGAPRRDGRALLIVEAAAARSAACEGKCGPGGGGGQ